MANDRSSLLKAVGERVRVRVLRLAAGLSQEALADQAGLHRTYVRSLERGERNVGLLNLYALAAALKAPPGELLSWN